MKQLITKAVLAFVALLTVLPTNAKGPPARPVLLTDANGVEIGRVIGMDSISRPYVLTDNGYRTILNLGSSAVPVMVRSVDEVFYENINCPKDEVAYIGGGNIGSVFSPTNDIETAYAEGRLMYSPPDAQLNEGVILKSMFGDEGCINFEEDPVTSDGFPAYRNDPGITGIENAPYEGRLILQ